MSFTSQVKEITHTVSTPYFIPTSALLFDRNHITNSAPVTDAYFKNSGPIQKLQRDLCGGDKFNQQCENSLSKGLNVTDSHVYGKVPHSRFKMVNF